LALRYRLAALALQRPPLLRLIQSGGDRDPRFTSHFGKALAAKLGVAQNLSTAFHPQTDGLSERKNQWIEQYLRLLTTAQQDDWDEWLTVASAIHNDCTNSTLGMTPNEALFGYHPNLYPRIMVDTPSEAVESRLDLLYQKRAQATAAINKAARTPHIIKEVSSLEIKCGLMGRTSCYPISLTSSRLEDKGHSASNGSSPQSLFSSSSPPHGGFMTSSTPHC